MSERGMILLEAGAEEGGRGQLHTTTSSAAKYVGHAAEHGADDTLARRAS